MRELACAICGGTARRRLYRETVEAEPRDAATRVADPEGRHYRINRCLGCGLVYSSPIFDEAGVAALYTHPHTNVREEDNVRNTFRGYSERKNTSWPGRTWPPGRRILDIGCDIGILLNMAAADSFEEMHGVEPNPMAAAVARAVPRSQIVETFYESTEYSEDHFDLVTLIHVVDHLVEPLRLLTRVRRDLVPGGLVLAVVHNVAASLLGARFPPLQPLSPLLLHEANARPPVRPRRLGAGLGRLHLQQLLARVSRRQDAGRSGGRRAGPPGPPWAGSGRGPAGDPSARQHRHCRPQSRGDRPRALGSGRNLCYRWRGTNPDDDFEASA